MKHLALRALERFWAFWLTPADPTPLAVLRLGTAAVGLLQLAVLWPALLTLYGNFGLVQWRVVDVAREGRVPGLSDLALALHPLGVSSASVVYAVFSLYGAALLVLALGLTPRLAAAVALLAHLTVSSSGTFSHYGVDTLLHITLVSLMVVPSSGRWSLDRWRGASDGAPSRAGRVGLRVLQVHLCLVYLNAGISKAQGEQWRSGEALWRALSSPQFAQLDASGLAHWPWLLAAGCWATIAIECGYAFAIWHPRLRRPWLAAVLSLHLGIAALMGLWLFSLLMAVLNVACFALSAQPRGAPAARPALQPVGEALTLAWGRSAAPPD